MQSGEVIKEKMNSRQVECFLKWNLWQESLDIDPSSLTLNRPYKLVSFQNNLKRITEWTWTQKRKMARLDMFDCVALAGWHQQLGLCWVYIQHMWWYANWVRRLHANVDAVTHLSLRAWPLSDVPGGGGIEHSLKRIPSIVTIYTSEKWFSFEFLQVKAKSHGKKHISIFDGREGNCTHIKVDMVGCLFFSETAGKWHQGVIIPE